MLLSTLGQLWNNFGTTLRKLGDNFDTTFGHAWWLLSDYLRSIYLPCGQIYHSNSSNSIYVSYFQRNSQFPNTADCDSPCFLRRWTLLFLQWTTVRGKLQHYINASFTRVFENPPLHVKSTLHSVKYTSQHDLARSCFQLWPMTGDEGGKTSKNSWRCECGDIYFFGTLSTLEPIMRAIIENMMSPDYGWM